MEFYVHDAEGNIVNSGQCQAETLSFHGGNGLTAVEGRADPASQYVDIATGAVCNYSQAEVDDKRRFRPGFRWSLGQWIDERQLVQAKDQKWSEIKRARAAIEFGTFAVDGYEFDCDKNSQTRINSAFQSAMDARTNGEPFSIDWTLSDNTNVTLTRAQVITMGRTLQEHVNAVFDRSRQLRSQIADATTKEELDGISW